MIAVAAGINILRINCQRDINAMNSCTRTVLDVLESIHCRFPERESSQLIEELKVKLRLLRTFYMCGRKWGKGVCSEPTLLSIEDTVHKHAQEVQSLCLRLRDDDDPVTSAMKWGHLHGVVSEFLVCIRQTFGQRMEELYGIFSDGSLQTTFSSQEVELVGIMDSLLQNLQDLLQYNKFCGYFTESLENLEENVRFLKNFILFSTFRGLQHSQMEDLLTHVEGLVVNAARLTFMSWNCDDRKMWYIIDQLTDRIRPFESHVCGIYVGVLEASKLSVGLSQQSSHHPTPGSHRLVLGDFVDSLIVHLWELLSCGSSYVYIFNHQMQKLYEGLTFLRTILREHQIKFDELYEKMHDLIGLVICEAGIIICYLFVKESEEGLVKKLELLFLDLEEKFKLIKAEDETQDYPLMSVSYFPQTNLLGFIDSVLEKMKSVSPYEAGSVALAKDKFQTVNDDLTFLKSFLIDVMVQCDQNRKLQTLRSRVGAVAYKTEFVLDSLVVGDTPQSLIVSLNTITEEINLIKAEASETFHSKRQITEGQSIAETYNEVPSAGEIQVLNELVVGLDDETEKIIVRLTRGTKHMDIVSVVGMPGLGKTTMAKKVYSHPSIVFHFHVRSWCSVSQVYTMKSLLLEMLSGLVKNFADKHSKMNEDDLAEELYKHLKGRKYLIILDDVWDTAVWNSLRILFPNDVNGSRILLTSRHHNVALQIKPDSEPHNLRSLTNDESWELLQKKINYEVGCPPALHELGMEIAQHCKGLPLMILIVAGILSNMKQDTWEEIAESLRKGTLSIIEQCMKTLELSYLHLPDHLKPCFLYFGAYQEDQQIPVRELLWLWIAEGFVEKTKRECSEDVAKGYLMELIQRSLVMVAKNGSRGGVKSCLLHDLLLDFCKEKCNEEHFLHCLHGYELGTSVEPTILYRLRVDSRRREDFAKPRLLSPHLRTLFFIADYKTRCPRHCYDILYKFCQSKLLKVVDLRRIDVGPFFPRVIELLVHLRYLALAIEETTLTIPSTIDNLSNLETFIIQRNLLRVSLPDTIWNMKKLRHLCITGSACWELPGENLEYPFNLENLITLSTVEFFCVQKMKEVMRKFPNVRRLKCVHFISEACTGDSKILALDFMNQLESLTLFQGYVEFHDLQFQFPSNLKKLVLSGFRLPWSEISTIDKLPNIEVLKLLENAFTGEIWDMEEEIFPKLRFLKLAYLDLARWTDSDDNFPRLQKLVLEGCPHLEEIPSCLAYIPTLQMIEVTDCESALSSIKQIQEEQIDVGNEDLKILIHPPQWTDI